MANRYPAANGVQAQVKHTVRQAGPWIERLARAGYAARGIVYIVIGILALEAAFAHGGKTTNNQGAIATIGQQPFGHFLLGIVGIGLAGFALWRFVQAGMDAENKGSDAKGAATRIGYIGSGVTYGLLAYQAFQWVAGAAPANTGNQSTQDWTARLLSAPGGQWLVALVGFIVIGVGLSQIVRGIKAKFQDKLDLNAATPAFRQWAVRCGQWGYAALGVVFAIIGGFVVQAAMHNNADKAKGLGSALDLLIEQPYGPFLLGIVAAGLAAFGIFELVEARYRRIRV